MGSDMNEEGRCMNRAPVGDQCLAGGTSTTHHEKWSRVWPLSQTDVRSSSGCARRSLYELGQRPLFFLLCGGLNCGPLQSYVHVLSPGICECDPCLEKESLQMQWRISR